MNTRETIIKVLLLEWGIRSKLISEKKMIEFLSEQQT